MVDPHRALTGIRIAVFADGGGIANRLGHLAADHGAMLHPLADPGDRVRDWFAVPFDVVVFNPFASVLGPESAISLARGIAGRRPLLGLAECDCPHQRSMMIAHGADDAMHLDGDGTEMVVRIAAMLRRHAVARALIACGDLRIDLAERQVSRDGRLIAMPAREFAMLSTLARTPDRAVSRATLWRAVWHLDFDPGTNRIDVHMSRLRSRVDAGFPFKMLQTVKGIGYALVSRAGAGSAWVAPAAG